MRKSSKILFAVFAILLSWSVYVYAAWHYMANFDSDEAVWKIMVDHILTGISKPVYFYGVNYLGSIEAYLAALLIKLLGNSIFTFRFGSLVFLLGFFIVNYLWLYRSFNQRIAIIATLLLGIPGPYLLTWLFRPIGALSALLFFGSSFLLLLTFSPKKTWQQVTQQLLIGIVVGLGLWSHSMMLVFIIAGSWPYIASSLIWHRLITKLKSKHLPLVAIAVSFISISTLAIIGTFFSSGCTTPLPLWWNIVSTITLVITVLLTLLVTLILISKYWLKFLLIITGGIVGLSPLWLTKTIPSSAITPSCPLEIPQHLHIIVSKIIPTVLATRPFSIMLTAPLFKLILWLLIGSIFVVALANFIYHQRLVLKSLFTLQTISQKHIPYVILTLLFGLPIFLAALGNNTIDEYSSRYLLITWLAVTVLLALFLERLYKNHAQITFLVFILYMLLAVFNMLSSQDTWTTYAHKESPNSIQRLEEYLFTKNITFGLAGYWDAYSITSLSDEKLIFTPFNGADRYPLYTQQTLAATRIALIVPNTILFPHQSTDDITSTLAKQVYDAGPFHKTLVEQLPQYTIIDRTSINDWNMYILEKQSY